MTSDEFIAAVVRILPDATIDESLDGEIVISTNLMEDRDGNIVPWKSRSES